MQAHAICWLICKQQGLTDDQAEEVWARVKGYNGFGDLLTDTLAEIAARPAKGKA